MTENGTQEGTDSGVPQGRYKRKPARELHSEQSPDTTEDGTVSQGISRKVQIGDATSPRQGSINIEVNVEAETRKEEMKRLNAKLRRLRGIG